MIALTGIAPSVLKYKATLFAGSTQHIKIGNVAALRFERTAAFSLGCWFRYTTAHLAVLIGKTGTSNTVAAGYDIHLNANNSVGVNLNNDFVGGNYLGFSTPNGSVAPLRWNHVVLTYNGSSDVSGCKVYVNGAPVLPLTTHRNMLSRSILSSAEFRIGNRHVAGNELPFAGHVLDGFVYNKELSVGEVATIHNSHCPPDLTAIGPTASLVGYWLCGSHIGDANLSAEATAPPLVPDASANANTGAHTNLTAGALRTRI